jgi:hypothetical protein
MPTDIGLLKDSWVSVIAVILIGLLLNPILQINGTAIYIFGIGWVFLGIGSYFIFMSRRMIGLTLLMTGADFVIVSITHLNLF